MIKVQGLTKSFGKRRVLDQLDFSMGQGSCCGIVGRNGSGKSVFLKCICGLMFPDEGVIQVNKKIIGKDVEVPEKTGAIIELPGFIPYLNAYQNLKYLSLMGNKRNESLKKLLEKVGLQSDNKTKVGSYSTGMKQRLGLAQALMDNPELLILDEPMNGLDDQGVDDIRRILLELKNQGVTILLSSHNPEDMEVLADCVYRMNCGKLVQQK